MGTAVWGLIGTVVGAIASIGAAWLAAHSTSGREFAKLQADRTDRAHAFQRQNLIDLQDALHDYMRLLYLAHLHDKAAYSVGAAWGTILLEDGLDAELRIANRRVSILIERISSDALRAGVKKLMGSATRVLLAKSEEASSLGIQQIGLCAIELFERLGSTLRSHY